MKLMNKRIGRIFAGLFLVLDIALIAFAIYMIVTHEETLPAGSAVPYPAVTSVTTVDTAPQTTKTVVHASKTDDTKTVDASITCPNVLLISVEQGTVLAERGSDTRIYPASLTKLMTLLLAVEAGIPETRTFTFTEAMLEPLRAAGASCAGFQAGETVTYRDLLYGCVLPSGADATSALAEMVAGSEAAFAERMNARAAELGMAGTHFVNASGLHDDNHYSTLLDLALLLEYTERNSACHTLLSTYQYTTTKTVQNPDGITLVSSALSRLEGNVAPTVDVVGGKTGFTAAAGNCLASFAENEDGMYIAVVAGGEKRMTPIYDTIALYASYVPMPQNRVVTTAAVTSQ